jgi:hypothetical protein
MPRRAPRWDPRAVPDPVVPNGRAARRSPRAIPLAALSLAVLAWVSGCRGGEEACSDPAGICEYGNLSVQVSTSGQDPDPDGYDVLLDGATNGSIGVDASRTLRVTATSHTVALGDVAPNCAVQGSPIRTVSVPLDGIASTVFSVVCEEIVVPVPVLDVTPSSLAFTTPRGESPGSKTITVRNAGDGTMSWNAGEDGAWLSLTPTSGSLGAGESATVTASVASGGLDAGGYAATVTITAPGATASPKTLAVTLTVTPPGQRALTVSGAGDGTGVVTSDPSAISCTLTAGSATGACAASFDEGSDVILTGTAAGGSEFSGWGGDCVGAGTGPCTVAMTVDREVEATFAALPDLSVTPTSLAFSAQQGTSPTPVAVTLRNAGGGTLAWSASDNRSWLSASPGSGNLAAGASETLTVTVSSNSLADGDYVGTVTVTGAGETVPVGVTLRIAPVPQQSLTVTGAGDGSGSVSSNPAGIACQVEAGGTSGTCAAPYDEGTVVTLTAVPAAGSSFGGWSGGCTGTGTCQVTMSAARSVEARFELDPTLEVDPTSLTFASQEGTDPATQTVTVRNGGGGTLNWTLTDDRTWLSGAPASGALGAGASETVTVSVASAGLTPGDYAGTVTISGAGDSREVAVQYTVTATSVAPTASFDPDCTGLTCDFADTSTDPDGTIVTWSWDFGDGATSTLQNPQHTYATGGPFTITLVVTDDDLLVSDPAVGTVSLSTPVQAGYQLEVRVSPGASLTSSQRAAVEAAVARWEEVISGDVQEATVIRAAALCGGATVPALNETVDDVVIYLDFVFIDGPGGTLGSAGPCSVRIPGYLPALGGMKFDTADLANLEFQGRLQDVILHEMGHVLGYGTIWTPLGLLRDPTSPGEPIQDTYFDGPGAIAAFDAVSDPDYAAGPKVPVENDNTVYGTGSLNGHWREGIFGAELMSPSLNFGDNPLSLVTIEAMGDVGYTVNPGAADPFSLAFNLEAGGAAPPIVIDLGDDIWRGPIEGIDAAGRTVEVVRP